MRLEQNSRPGVGPAAKRQSAQSTTNEMRLGIALPRFGDIAGPAAMATIAARAEALGYDSAWILPHDAEGIPDAYTLFSYLAGRTQRISLGTWLTETSCGAPELLRRIGSTNTLAAGRITIAVTHPAGYHDGSLAYQIPARLVEVAPESSSMPVPGAAAVARCQVTYQPLEGKRHPFSGTFGQIAEDIARYRAYGVSELIVDLSYSASVSRVEDYLFHLQRLREAVYPGAAAQTFDDPFDYIV